MRSASEFDDDDEFDTTAEEFDAYMAEGVPARLVDPPGVLRVQPWHGTASGNTFVPATPQP